jgi:hypothetical protein
MFLVIAASVTAGFVDDRRIQGSIRAEWSETPLLHDQGMLDGIQSSALSLRTAEAFLNFIAAYIFPELVPLFNFSLDLRYYSPRIEFYRQLLGTRMTPQVKCRNAIVDDLDYVY